MMRSNMSDNLHDLDLELELLKRKRMIIQKQQEMLANDRQFHQRHQNYNFNAPQGFVSNLTYPQLYDDRSGAGYSNSGREFGQKRQAPTQWRNDGPPKRRGKSKKFVQRPNPWSNPDPWAKNPEPWVADAAQPWAMEPKPLFDNRSTSSRPQSIANQVRSIKSVKPRPTSNQRLGNQKSNTKPKVTFKPNVRNSKTSNPLKKFESYSPRERKNLVTKASDLVTKIEESSILRADVPPTQQMTGRLELGLGNVLKDIRQEFSTNDTYSVIFVNSKLIRVLKQAIRDRMRTAMLGKSVGNVKDIIDCYRNQFPKETDKDLVDLALKAVIRVDTKSGSAIPLIEAGSPERYFNLNTSRLFDTKLTEIFEKVKKICHEKNKLSPQDIIDAQLESVKTACDTSIAQNVDTDCSKIDRDIEGDIQEVSDTSTKTVIDLTTNPDHNESINCTAAAISNTTDVENNLSDNTKLNITNDDNMKTISPTTVDNAISLKTDDTVNETTSAIADNAKETSLITDDTVSETTSTSVDKAQATNTTTNEDKSENIESIDKEIVKESLEIPNTQNASAVETEGVDNKNIKENFNAWKYFNDKYFQADFYDKLIEAVLERKLPRLLRKYRSNIMQILEVDEMYKTTMKTISENTAKKLKINEAGNKPAQSTKSPHKERPEIKHYVKIIGRPALPKKSKMKGFLAKFNPLTIKKHRNVRNLLYVGFSDADINNILEANGAVIGFSTLSIIKSDKAQISNLSKQTQENDKTNENDEANIDDCQIFSKDLDDQITDLLSRIKDTEENSENNDAISKIPDEDLNLKVVVDKEKPEKEELNNSDKLEDLKDESEINENIKADDVNAEGTNEDIKDTELTAEDSNATSINNHDKPQEEGEAENNGKTEAISQTNKQVVTMQNDKKGNNVVNTPTRSSARRLANSTPASVTTRRASKLGQNNQ